MYFLGIDIGSTTSKAVLVNEQGKLLKKALVVAGTGTDGPNLVYKEILEGIDQEELMYIVATGYGRNLFKDANTELSELSCHAKGVAQVFDDVKVVIDIGGQDAKVLKLAENGRLDKFIMNDKCAAGTGRFLDVMSNILHVNIDDMGAKAMEAKEIVKISSTCTVFAESEVISQLANGVEIPDLIAGICQSITQRVSSLAKRIGIEPKVCMTGGVARNVAIRKYMGEALNQEIVFSPLSQYMGAYGAAVYAIEKYKESKK